ncbi:peroxiredoxin [Chitinophaga dinghuensis]|uniref:Peroxiredoxin n=1 Tax=Chitinophaga dinghuensis TaxID=1539050 RepID=A0A327W739_9BACT|nr:TlpA disulfide reductase family protein [Chitinophaga dinghuensis]RAJ81838.1 peroxiredoxin [Chitinophaga dinghuensis]
MKQTTTKNTVILAAAMLAACPLMAQQQPYVINGKLTQLTAEKKVFVSYKIKKEHYLDSTVTHNGIFQIKGKVDGPVQATISLKPIDDDGSFSIKKLLFADEQEFFLEKGTTTIKGTNNMESAIIKGGAVQKDNEELRALYLPIVQQYATPFTAYKYALIENDKAKSDSLRSILMPYYNQVSKIKQTYQDTHPASFVAWTLLLEKSSIINPDTFGPQFEKMDAKFKNSEKGKELTAKIEIARKTGIGKVAPEFKLPDVNGKEVALSSLRGKYVLVDFWASWCGPCRAENPNVRHAYEALKGSNFEIIAISLDNKKDAWEKAIKDDQLPWIHVSDLQGWGNVVAKDYGVTAVPQNLLLDPKGVIIAKNIRGEELLKKLQEHIK